MATATGLPLLQIKSIHRLIFWLNIRIQPCSSLIVIFLKIILEIYQRKSCFYEPYLAHIICWLIPCGHELRNDSLVEKAIVVELELNHDLQSWLVIMVALISLSNPSTGFRRVSGLVTKLTNAKLTFPHFLRTYFIWKEQQMWGLNSNEHFKRNQLSSRDWEICSQGKQVSRKHGLQWRNGATVTQPGCCFPSIHIRTLWRSNRSSLFRLNFLMGGKKQLDRNLVRVDSKQIRTKDDTYLDQDKLVCPRIGWSRLSKWFSYPARR